MPRARGVPLSLSGATAAIVVGEACRKPRDVGVPIERWSHATLGEYLRAVSMPISDRTVGRILASAALQPHRQRMWLTSHDEAFREKRDDVLRVYYETPVDEH